MKTIFSFMILIIQVYALALFVKNAIPLGDFLAITAVALGVAEIRCMMIDLHERLTEGR